MVLDNVGNLYGTTSQGGDFEDSACITVSYGCGEVFKLDPAGHLIGGYAFIGDEWEGGWPRSAVTLDAAGNVYGTNAGGGFPNWVCGGQGCGVLFEVDQYGFYGVLYHFTGWVDGGVPYGNVIFDAAGNLYGTTEGGGAFRKGVVFKLDPRGVYTVLHSFNGTDGAYPYAGLVLDADGNLYGTTAEGGKLSACPGGCGVVFKITMH